MVEETTFSVEEMEEAFHNDPVYEKISSMGLKSTLLEGLPQFESMELSKTYSTKETATFLYAKEHRLINTLNRELLFPYFQVKRKGGANRYVYDWQAIWRFKMIFLLMDVGELKLVDIEEFLISSGVLREGSESVVQRSNSILKEGQKGEALINSEALETLKKEIDTVRSSFLEEIEEIKDLIVQKEDVMATSLKSVLIQEYIHQDEFLEKLENRLKKGFSVLRGWGYLFSWWKEDPAQELVDNLLVEVKNNRKFLKEKINSLEHMQNDYLLYINAQELVRKQRAAKRIPNLDRS